MIVPTVTEESTRLAMLKRGEADIVYSIRGALAEELQRTPGPLLQPPICQSSPSYRSRRVRATTKRSMCLPPMSEATSSPAPWAHLSFLGGVCHRRSLTHTRGFLTDSRTVHNPSAVTGSLTGLVTVAAVERASRAYAPR